MTLNLEQTTPSFLISTHLKETSSTLKEPSQHDLLVEKTSKELEIIASQAPYRTSRPDNTNYIHQLDHGTHDRTDKNTRYAPVAKHPASMSKTECARHRKKCCEVLVVLYLMEKRYLCRNQGPYHQQVHRFYRKKAIFGEFFSS